MIKIVGMDLADITFRYEKGFSDAAIKKNPLLKTEKNLVFAYNGHIINVKSSDAVAPYLLDPERRSELYSITVSETTYEKTLINEKGEETKEIRTGYAIEGFIPTSQAVGFLKAQLQTVGLTAQIEAIKSGAFKMVSEVSSETANVLEGMASE